MLQKFYFVLLNQCLLVSKVITLVGSWFMNWQWHRDNFHHFYMEADWKFFCSLFWKIFLVLQMNIHPHTNHHLLTEKSFWT